MLDDQEYIKRFDSQNALNIMLGQWEQLEYNFSLPRQEFRPKNIVFAGMGGSALAAQLSITWPGYSVPFEIVRDYNLPRYVDETTLLIVSSYSGNTEEELSVLHEAKNLGCKIVAISSGGKIRDLSRKDGFLCLDLPSGLQPRHAVFYSLKALLVVMEAYGLANEIEVTKQLHRISIVVKESLAAWAPSVPTEQNLAKQLANKIMGKTPIMYASSILYPAAYKWKINFNENSKNTSWCGQYSEFNHNEFLGWSSHPVEKPFAIIDLISSFDHPQIKKRFEISDRLLSGKRPKAMQIQAEGEDVLEQLLWTVALGDMTSIYLALLNGVNPTPVDLIEKLKLELQE
jgi:glucose/mannose-6-phosphate isomerase